MHTLTKFWRKDCSSVPPTCKHAHGTRRCPERKTSFCMPLQHRYGMICGRHGLTSNLGMNHVLLEYRSRRASANPYLVNPCFVPGCILGWAGHQSRAACMRVCPSAPSKAQQPCFLHIWPRMRLRLIAFEFDRCFSAPKVRWATAESAFDGEQSTCRETFRDDPTQRTAVTPRPAPWLGLSFPPHLASRSRFQKVASHIVKMLLRLQVRCAWGRRVASGLFPQGHSRLRRIPRPSSRAASQRHSCFLVHERQCAAFKDGCSSIEPGGVGQRVASNSSTDPCPTPACACPTPRRDPAGLEDLDNLVPQALRCHWAVLPRPVALESSTPRAPPPP